MGDNRIITLTTDFGLADQFAAEMKGVILSINPHAAIVDVTHLIQPQDIGAAAYIIDSGFRYFPSGTIHVAVVDPGVGSERNALIVEAAGHYFIGPDNGIFTHILNRTDSFSFYRISEEKYMLSKDSPTFQGRDLFAPVAAWLSKGLPVSEFGPRVEDVVRLAVPGQLIAEGKVSGEVIHIDHFGNAISNIRRETLAAFSGGYSVEINGRVVRRAQYYAQAEEDGPGWLINSSGYLELFVRNGNAAGKYNIKRGDKVMAISLTKRHV